MKEGRKKRRDGTGGKCNLVKREIPQHDVAGGGGAWEIEYRDIDTVLSRSAGGWCRCWDPVCTVANPTILYST
jgi:hypothetical protein